VLPEIAMNGQDNHSLDKIDFKKRVRQLERAQGLNSSVEGSVRNLAEDMKKNQKKMMGLASIELSNRNSQGSLKKIKGPNFSNIYRKIDPFAKDKGSKTCHRYQNTNFGERNRSQIKEFNIKKIKQIQHRKERNTEKKQLSISQLPQLGRLPFESMQNSQLNESTDM
jgi:hypothetical protein